MCNWSTARILEMGSVWQMMRMDTTNISEEQAEDGGKPRAGT
jgi:hypothetical protein